MGKLAKIFIFFSLIIFGFLLAKNPYSTRNLIPNLEPYPDTFHYIIPAISLSSGGPFKIVREGRTINPSVPPLYSFVLTPFFVLSKDPRAFYFANIILSLISVYILYLIIKKITQDIWITGLIIFLFVTNYFIYWYPTLAMAENLILPIFLGSVYLLIAPISRKNIFFASTIPLLLYATKYAYLPYLISYIAIYLIKIYLDRRSKIDSRLLIFPALTFAFLIPIIIYQFYLQEVNPLSLYINIFTGLIAEKTGHGSQVNSFVSSAGWFSVVFFQKNWPIYVRGLMGEPTRFLWDFTPILPKYLIFPAWIGLVWGSLRKKFRFISISLIFLLLFHLLIISSFSTLDFRYTYHAIPTLLLGLGILLVLIKEVMIQKDLGKYSLILIFGILGFYLVMSFGRIKYQIALNLRHSETPWYYVSVLNLNDYFTKDKVVNGKKPVVISPMPPYYIDYFSNGNYSLLPLSEDQEFRLNKIEAWGPNDYSDLPKLYKKYLADGYSLYVSIYGLGNVNYLHTSFDEINNDFTLVEVKDGCYGECKIYKLGLKNAKSF